MAADRAACSWRAGGFGRRPGRAAPFSLPRGRAVLMMLDQLTSLVNLGASVRARGRCHSSTGVRAGGSAGRQLRGAYLAAGFLIWMITSGLSVANCSAESSPGQGPGAVEASAFPPWFVAPSDLPSTCSGLVYYAAASNLCEAGLTYFECQDDGYAGYDCSPPPLGGVIETLGADSGTSGTRDASSGASMGTASEASATTGQSAHPSGASSADRSSTAASSSQSASSGSATRSSGSASSR